MKMIRADHLAGLIGAAALLAASLSGCARQRPTADQVLTRMAQAYRELDTLREHVQARVGVTRAGVRAGQEAVALELDWSFAQPNKLRYKISRYRPVELVSDGKQVCTILPEALQAITTEAPARVSEFPALHYSAAAVVGINEFRLLEGGDPRRLLDDIRLEPDDSRAGGVWCHVLSGDVPGEVLREIGAASGAQRIWVGREDFLLRRYTVDLRWVTERRPLEALPGTEPDVLERYESLRVEVARLEPNVALPPETFRYTPPEGFRVVADLRGQPLPDVALPDLQGRPVSLAGYRGKNLMLVFWASWEIGSLDQLSVMQQFRDRHPDEDLVILTVTLDVATEDARQWLREREITLPTLQAGGDLERRIKDLDVVSLPKIFLVDKKGIIRDLIADPAGLPQLEEAARAAGFEL